MRSPFTVNRPNAKKIKAGRVPVLADVVSDLRGLVVYTVEDFTPAAVSNEMTTTRTKSSGTAYETIGSPMYRHRSISQRSTQSPQHDRERAQEGYSKSRSEAVYNGACDLRRLGWGDGDVLLRSHLSDETESPINIFDQKTARAARAASRVIMDMNRRKIAQVFGDAIGRLRRR